MKIGIGVLVATQMMNVVFVPFLQHAGLALSTSVGACANALMLYVGLKRRGAIRLQPGWMVFFAQLGAGLLVLAGVLYLAARPWRRTGVLALVVGLGALAYLGTLVATGLRLSQFMRKI